MNNSYYYNENNKKIRIIVNKQECGLDCEYRLLCKMMKNSLFSVSKYNEYKKYDKENFYDIDVLWMFPISNNNEIKNIVDYNTNRYLHIKSGIRKTPMLTLSTESAKWKHFYLTQYLDAYTDEKYADFRKETIRLFSEFSIESLTYYNEFMNCGYSNFMNEIFRKIIILSGINLLHDIVMCLHKKIFDVYINDISYQKFC